MYPTYALQVYDHIQKTWIDSCSHEASSKPHHYDKLYPEWQRLVNGAKGGSPNQRPIGYRIIARDDGCVTVYDQWDNGKLNHGNAPVISRRPPRCRKTWYTVSVVYHTTNRESAVAKFTHTGDVYVYTDKLASAPDVKTIFID